MIVGSDVSGPIDTLYYTVLVNPTPIVTYTITNTSCSSCSDGSIDITISSANTYSVTWTLNGSFFSNFEDLTNLNTGLYNLEVITIPTHKK